MTRVTRDVESNTSIDDLRLVCSVVCLDEHVNMNLFQMAAKNHVVKPTCILYLNYDF